MVGYATQGGQRYFRGKKLHMVGSLVRVGNATSDGGIRYGRVCYLE